MSEVIKTLFMFLLLAGALFLVLWITGWKMKKAAAAIVMELRARKAFDPASARELPYGKEQLFRVGLRDYRPRALAALVKQGVVRVPEGGKYYLSEGASDIAVQPPPGDPGHGA